MWLRVFLSVSAFLCAPAAFHRPCVVLRSSSGSRLIRCPILMAFVSAHDLPPAFKGAFDDIFAGFEGAQMLGNRDFAQRARGCGQGWLSNIHDHGPLLLRCSLAVSYAASFQILW